MNDDILKSRKTRSASICAPGFSSIEQILGNVPSADDKEKKDMKERAYGSGSGTPDSSSTPTRKRRVAARSQSARVSGGNKSVRRKACTKVTAVYHNYHHEGSIKSPHCSSEPKLNESDVSPYIKRRSNRRGQSMHHAHHKKQNIFLDLPHINTQIQTDLKLKEEGDSYRLRSFSLTSKGVINRGDSFKKKRSRSSSLIPAESVHQIEQQSIPKEVVISHDVGLLGAQGVGKTALISQFMTSDCINAYDRQKDTTENQSISVMLNGEESELKFSNITNLKVQLEKSKLPDAFVIMYSVIDKASFQKAEEYLIKLHDRDILRNRATILVGNKVDLVRSRAVSPQDGKCMACTYRAKFIEISVAINHNVDDLLVGILNQIRLKYNCAENCRKNGDSSIESGNSHWYRSRGVIRASMKARQMLTWLFGKEDSKFKNCENLHIL